MIKIKTFRWYYNDVKNADAQMEKWIKANPTVKIKFHSLGGNGSLEHMYTQIIYETDDDTPVQQLNS